jgi:hypothetical protein
MPILSAMPEEDTENTKLTFHEVSIGALHFLLGREMHCRISPGHQDGALPPQTTPT